MWFTLKSMTGKKVRNAGRNLALTTKEKEEDLAVKVGPEFGNNNNNNNNSFFLSHRTRAGRNRHRLRKTTPKMHLSAWESYQRRCIERERSHSQARIKYILRLLKTYLKRERKNCYDGTIEYGIEAKRGVETLNRDFNS